MVTADFYIIVTFHDFWFCCDKNIRSPKNASCDLMQPHRLLSAQSSVWSLVGLWRQILGSELQQNSWKYETPDLLQNSHVLHRFTSGDEMRILPSLWRSSLLRTCWQFGLVWFLFWSGLSAFLQISQTVSDSLGSTGSAGCWVRLWYLSWSEHQCQRTSADDFTIFLFFFLSFCRSFCISAPLILLSKPHISDSHDEAWWSTHFLSRCWSLTSAHAKVAGFVGRQHEVCTFKHHVTKVHQVERNLWIFFYSRDPEWKSAEFSKIYLQIERSKRNQLKQPECL